jgi:hypothetical protein
MAKQVISNKVYESLQVPTEQSRNTVGKILYANSFSGVAQVPMPADLKALIDSDLGLIGNNILVQLEQKMKGYPNGPWYIDSRDGVIYIHNRKFTQEPEYNYIYQSENGEVLRVSFTMQNVTKRAKAQLTETIDPDDKGLIVGSTDIKEPEKAKEEMSTVTTPYVAQVDNTMVVNYGSVPYEDYRSHPTTNIAAEMEAEQRYGAKAQKHNQAVKEYGSKKPYVAYQAGKQEMLDNLSTDQYREAINTAANNLPSDKKRQLQQILKNSKNGKELESNLRQLLENERYLFTGEYKMEYLAEEWVDPREYDPEGGTITHMIDIRTFSSNPYEKQMIDNQSQRGIAAMEKNPYITVYPDTYKLDYSGEGVTTPTMTRKVKAKVKIRRMKKVPVLVPIYKLYHNLFGRYGGADKVSWAMNANANGGLKTTERKLVCQMTVVGRPSLQSSQVISLENVGKRWSGYWYIKSVQHSMDVGQGYLCTLDLIKSNAKAGQTTSKTQLSTQDIVSNDAKDGAKTQFGKDKKSTANASNIVHEFTYSEAVYFKESFMNDKNVIIDKKGAGEFLQNKFYYDELNAKDPQALAAGTVRTEGTIVTSNGTAIYGKTKVVKVDQSKVTPAMKEKYSFDWSEWARNEYLNVVKNKKNN